MNGKIKFPAPKLQIDFAFTLQHFRMTYLQAEKSHQKARQRGFTKCWAVVNVGNLDMAKAKGESPSTDSFYSLAVLIGQTDEAYKNFCRRIMSLTSIAPSE